MSASAPAVGIDLGTTNSSVAAVLDGEVAVLADAQGRTTTPSVVAFPEGGGTIVGHDARRRLVHDPANTVYSAKRLIGRPFADPAVRAARATLPYDLVADPAGHVAVRTRSGTYSMVEIGALVISHVASVVRARTGDQTLRAVVTVPANFNDAQRELTRVAGRIAGLDVVRIVNEPTAAAVAFGFDGSRDGLVAVYDFGGGTFDVSVVEIRGGVYRVLATAGDPFLGGDDVDVALAGRLADRFRREARVDLRRSQAEWQRLLFAAERAKCDLSDVEETEVVVEEAAFGEGGAVDLRMRVGRDDLVSVAYTFVERSIDLVRRAVAAARVGHGDLSDVILVGGTTRIPFVAQAVGDHFGRAPRTDVDPLHAVALGAALHAALITGVPVRPRAGGAAGALLLDVLPHSIGIAVAGGGVEWILEAGSVVPTEETRTFTTWRDGQTEMRFVLLQGDSSSAAENARLGDFVVSSLRPDRAGAVPVDVTFEVDVNGILCVTAIDRDSGRQASRRLRISAPGDDEIAAARRRVAGLGGGET